VTAGLIAVYGLVLAAVHLWHGYAHLDSTVTLIIGAGIPFTFALCVVYGGYWATKQGYQGQYQRYLLLWTVGGSIGVTGLGALLIMELRMHGTPVAEPTAVLASVATTGAIAGLVIGIYGIQSRRKTELVTSLQEAATALMEAETRQAVAEETVAIAQDVLDMSIAGVWLYDEDAETLEPVAATTRGNNEFSEHPTYREGNSLSWGVFERGEPIIARNLEDYPERHNPETKLRSELILPLGDQGVLNVGSTQRDAFDETDISVAHILASTATSIAVKSGLTVMGSNRQFSRSVALWSGSLIAGAVVITGLVTLFLT
jgi:putative methionine-R-sulfoxide reductase with GAF domain